MSMTSIDDIASEASQAREWAEPIPFGSSAAMPSFPLETLPPAIGAFCAAVAESRQVPADLPAMVALGVLAGASARRFRVRIKSDYFEPLNLFISAALEPGERKSATFRDCLEPLSEAERASQE